jgi:hypothetical protein
MLFQGRSKVRDSLTATPLHLGGKGFRRLVPSQLERLLLRAHLHNSLKDGWTPKARENSIFFDLSRVEWVDIGALVQLTLLIESAVRNGIRVATALPLPRARKSESRFITETPELSEYVTKRIANRKLAYSFLQVMQFLSAVRLDHLPSDLERPLVLHDYDQSESETESIFSPTSREVEQMPTPAYQEYLYKLVFPLKWTSSISAPERHDLTDFLTRVLAEHERGLETLDASALTNVLVHELVENVATHAATVSSALIAAWATPSSYQATLDDFLQEERPYLQWLSSQARPLVQVFVGDSGVGITEKLLAHYRAARLKGLQPTRDDADDRVNTMFWAFDRWSSSKNSGMLRGTRGLYRVNRIVTKYQGLITVRAEDHLVGLDHGGAAYDAPVFDDSRPLARTPGTIFTLRIPAYRESIQPRLSVAQQPNIEAVVIDLGELVSGGIAPQSLEALRILFAGASAPPTCVVGLVGTALADKSSIERCLRQAADLRHPGAFVLAGLSGGQSFLETITNSVNEELKEEHRHSESAATEHFQVWDPVLVLMPGNLPAWVGATETTRTVLNELVLRGGRLTAGELRMLLPDEQARAEVLRTFRNDPHLIRLGDDGVIQLLPTLAALSSRVQSFVAGKLGEHFEHNGGGVFHDGPYRTPSLATLEKWVDVGSIFRSTLSPNVCMFALAILIQKECSTYSHDVGSAIILTDAWSYAPNVEALRNHLHLRRKEVLSQEHTGSVPPRLHMFEPFTPVLIYCDILASGETARQCLRQVLRDGAVPVVVACLFDFRRDCLPIKMWGIEVPVVALSHIPLTIAEPQEVPANVNPITRQIEEVISLTNEEDRPISQSELASIVEVNNALHISHIGRPLGRHFTFYIDASRLIDHPVISAAFDSVISEWIGHGFDYSAQTAAEQIEIWYPEPEPKPSAPARRFAESIQRSRADVHSVHVFRREEAYGEWHFSEGPESTAQRPNILIVDWGALTGTTVTQMIRLAAGAGAKRVLACICLSQLPLAEETFLTLLRSLSVQRWEEKRGQLLLPMPSNTLEGSVDAKAAGVEVSVRFLSRYPITSYSPDQCPLCQQLLGRDQMAYPTDLLEAFARSEREPKIWLGGRWTADSLAL